MKHLSKHNTQVLYLYVSTLLGSLLGFATSIVNTHFLSESDYGDVRYVQNLITLLASLLLFGYFLSGSRLLALSKVEAPGVNPGGFASFFGICSDRTPCSNLALISSSVMSSPT